MGISADQFWQSSANGKAMVVMLARRGDVELVRDICDWLVSKHRKDIEAASVQAGASAEQAKTRSDNAVVSLQAIVDGIGDRNCETAAINVIDSIFQRFYNKGKPAYDQAMLWFANELRGKIKD